MALGLYKAGQGYWVRVLTAAMAGIIVLAGCAWLWNELEAASSMIPRPTWKITLAAPVTGDAADGQAVVLMGEAATAGLQEIGKAVVKSSAPTSAGGSVVFITRIQMTAGHDPSMIRSFAPAEGGATLAGMVAGTQSIPMFDPLYLQAAGVALLMILGAAVTYWFTGVRAGTVEFLIATDGEMKKVNWSTRKDIIASTWVVILWAALLAGGLFAVDLLFSIFFKAVGVLQTK